MVATTCGGVAGLLGYEDHGGAPADEMLAAAGRIARSVEVPVTVDAEAGYGASLSTWHHASCGRATPPLPMLGNQQAVGDSVHITFDNAKIRRLVTEAVSHGSTIRSPDAMPTLWTPRASTACDTYRFVDRSLSFRTPAAG